MNQKHTVSVPEYGLTIATGSIAKFANGAVSITIGETVVFVTATAATKLRPGQDFFPLTVDYREKMPPPAGFPAATSSAKAVPPKRKFSPPA